MADTLYPPIVASNMPAFVRTDPCAIYFTLPSSVTVDKIKNVQVSVVYSQTNASALKKSLYPSDIKITEIYTFNNKYFISISPNDVYQDPNSNDTSIQNTGTSTNSQSNESSIGSSSNSILPAFRLNYTYKVRLRFTSIQAEDPPSNASGLNQWLSDNAEYFSSWSNSCLIRGIEQPKIYIQDFDSEETVDLLNETITLVGKLYYDNPKETEYLKSYKIYLYEGTIRNLGNLLLTTEDIFTDPNTPNEINYTINYLLLQNHTYSFRIDYTTNNLYKNWEWYSCTGPIVEYFQAANLTTTEDMQSGRIKIDFSLNEDTISSDLIIKRSSSKTNFIQWENLKTIPYSQSLTGFIWYDISIESGIWYKYRVQETSIEDGGRTSDTEQPIMCVFEDTFLTTADKQLKVKFNPSVSNFKYNVSESQQVTLGSQFPFVKRNGSNYFRSFSIGGLITSLIDSAQWYDNNIIQPITDIMPFSSKAQIYGEAQTLYENNYDFDYYKDYIYEREFRKKVKEFLYKNDIKLFRSLTEGNILVKLMDISLQPVNELGRLLYSFTATAVEIDEANASNYSKYNVINTYYQEKQEE